MTAPCVFCAIVMRESPAKILYETDTAIVIEPLNPVTEGHALVIPKTHVVDARQSEYVTGLTFEVAALYLSANRPNDDFNLITSSGPAATQTVQHLHVHVVPRRKGDGLHLPWTGQRKEPRVGMEWDHRKHATLPNGTKITDVHGTDWTVTYDGGMAERFDDEGRDVASAGIVWLERHHGPLRVQSVPEDGALAYKDALPKDDEDTHVHEWQPPKYGYDAAHTCACGVAAIRTPGGMFHVAKLP